MAPPEEETGRRVGGVYDRALTAGEIRYVMDPCPVLPIPAMGPVGMTLLVLALLTAGTVLLVQRHVA